MQGAPLELELAFLVEPPPLALAAAALDALREEAAASGSLAVPEVTDAAGLFVLFLFFFSFSSLCLFWLMHALFPY